jgi:hypothetical protein
MVNIYLFFELLGSAVDALKALQMENCKCANAIMLSDEELTAQLDERRSEGCRW